MKQRAAEQGRVLSCLLLGCSVVLAVAYPTSLVHAASPITPSGLNTQVTLSATPPPGKIQYDITGGTRPGGGPNLFHSFGNFNVPNNNIANFLNDSGLATSNILGRINGGNISNIFGTIQTTGFGNANLFLMNPAGFLFGPNATINVGGMVSFTSADYLRLADGARFNAVPHAHADALLSVAPVAAFGFLGSNPGAITVQGSQLTVAEGTGISLVGGNITVQGGTLTAPSGQINLVSVGKPSHRHVGGEVTNGAGFVATGFKSFGAITVSSGSTIDTSGIASSGHAAGSVSIRGGQFVMDDSSITARPAASADANQINGNIEVTADQVALSNHSTIDTSGLRPGNITFNVSTFSATDSTISANGGFIDVNLPGPSGAVTIQGLQGSGSSAQAVSLTHTTVSSSGRNLGEGEQILIQADNIALNQSNLAARAPELNGGIGGTIHVAGNRVDMTATRVDTSSSDRGGGQITVDAKNLTLTNSQLLSASGFQGGTIHIDANKVGLTDSQLTTSVTGGPQSVGGTITVDANKVTLNNSQVLSTATEGQGGTIHIDANKVALTDSQLNTSVTGGPQSVGGTITVDANKATLNNSQVLSTATEGHGGTIGITTHKLNSIDSVIDATSQTGTNGTVTIQHP